MNKNTQGNFEMYLERIERDIDYLLDYKKYFPEITVDREHVNKLAKYLQSLA